ncbi:MAG TPA: endonuclease III [Sphingomicrobium sp.]|nr:endonuclease III [Sphingomicrobium sp.]
MKREQVFEFFRRLAEANPSPTTELDYTNPYTLLVAVVLSAQATDASVNVATKPLFTHIDTPEKMIAFGEEALRDAIKRIGLFNTKAKNVILLSHALIDQHDSKVPQTRDELQALPGVGRKTANVVLNTAFGEETFAVDTHVFRVCNRTGLAPGKTPDEVEAKLDRIVPQPFRRDAHHWLILQGRYTCKARLPECWRCLVVDLCRYQPKTEAPAERVKSSAGRSVSRASSTARTGKSPIGSKPKADRNRPRPSRLP